MPPKRVPLTKLEVREARLDNYASLLADAEAAFLTDTQYAVLVAEDTKAVGAGVDQYQ